MATVNYYYDIDHELTHEDDEGCLVALCRDCKITFKAMQWAGEGCTEAECYECDATNNPWHRAEMIEYYASREEIENV